MSGEVNRLQKVKQELDQVSPSFCTAKWLQVTLHLQNGFNHSCHHPSTHKINLDEIAVNPSAVHNTAYKKQQRKMMLEGQRPAECQYCWNVEDLPGNHISDRIGKSADVSWSYDKIAEVSRSPWDKDVAPTYVEISFSNHCNFKCSYCSPVHSSQWEKEAKEFGPYPTSQHYNGYDWLANTGQLPIPHDQPNPYVDAFWDWWPELYQSLRVFRVTGGEPLMEKNTFLAMDRMVENPKPSLEFSINTNACVSDSRISKYIEKAKLLEGKIRLNRVYTSVDTHGEQAEYIRNGLNYQQWYSNVDRILTELPKTKVTVMCTANLMSVTNFTQMLRDIYFLKVKHYNNSRKVAITIDISILRWPGHQRANILPPEYADMMLPALEFMKAHEEGNKENNIPHYKGFFDFEIAKLERFIEFIRSPINPAEKVNISVARADFYKFVNEHDRRRNTDFLQTFPQLTDFYQMCKRESENRIL